MAVSIRIGVWSPSRLQPLANVVAMHVGQHQIEHDDVELAGLGEVDSFGAGRGDGNAMVLRAEPAIDEVGYARLVFDQEHVHALPPLCRPATRP